MSLSQLDRQHISFIIAEVLNELKARIEHEEHTQEAVERRMDTMTVPDLSYL